MDASIREVFTGIYQRAHQIGLWRWIAWGIAGTAIWDGAGYFVNGNSIANGPSFEIMKQLPGGMRTHGLVMLILAALVIYFSYEKAALSRRVFLAVFAYSIWVSSSLIAGWTVTHQIVWSGVSKWFLIAWLALGLAANTVQESRSGEVD